MTEQELFEKAANKSLGEIADMEKVLRQAIRYYASRKLMDFDEEKPYECHISLSRYPYESAIIENIYQLSDGSGIILVREKDMEEDQDLDDYALEDQLEIIQGIE